MVPEETIVSDSQMMTKESFYNLDPYEIEDIYLINPSVYLDNVSDRIFEYNMYKQKGRFLILPNKICNEPINKSKIFNDFLFHIKIPQKYKETIRQTLADRGITREYLFSPNNPDHNQLIAEINKKIFNV